MEDIRNERPEYGRTADLYNRDTLLEIVNAVRGHPLAASNAVKYIIRVVSQYKEATAGSRFVAMTAGNNYQARQHFLNYSPDSPSIMETFEVSQSRLSKPDAQARALMNFLSLIETEGEEDFDFRDFFFEHSCPVPPKDFPDHPILGAESFQLQDLFSELEKVSFGERLQTSRPFQFHPLWLECTRHSMGPKGRIRYARQVLLICYHTICVDHGIISIIPDIDDSFLPHVRKCMQVCGSFKIGLDDLKLPAKVSKFFKVVEGTSWACSEIRTSEGFKYFETFKLFKFSMGGSASILYVDSVPEWPFESQKRKAVWDRWAEECSLYRQGLPAVARRPCSRRQEPQIQRHRFLI